MIKPEIRDRVQKLCQAGKGIRWIARHLGITRHKVRKILRGLPSQEDPPSQVRPSLLDPFRRRIQAMVEEGFTSALIFRRLRPEGYAGGRTILDDYVRSIRGLRHERRAFVRFETLPAEESQQDLLRGFGLNLGLGLGPRGGPWSIRPEAGILFAKDDVKYLQASVGVSLRPH